MRTFTCRSTFLYDAFLWLRAPPVSREKNENNTKKFIDERKSQAMKQAKEREKLKKVTEKNRSRSILGALNKIFSYRFGVAY